MTTNSNKNQIITGWIISGFVILFMLFDAVIKFLKPAEVIKTTVNELGYAEHHILIHGILALTATLLYAIPRTSILGAIILTGHFGGAIASHLRVDNPIFSHTLFPVYVGILMWLGLWLRNKRFRNIFPLTNISTNIDK
ncbi:MAG: hypothetical protein RLY89_1479 [Bacteroidota bacterium]|jgi:hypothetical protein